MRDRLSSSRSIDWCIFSSFQYVCRKIQPNPVEVSKMQEKSIKMQGKCAGAKNPEESEKRDPPAPEFRVNHGLTFKVCSDPPDRVSLFCQRKIKSSKLLLFCEFPVYRSSPSRCTEVPQAGVQICTKTVVQKLPKPRYKTPQNALYKNAQNLWYRNGRNPWYRNC